MKFLENLEFFATYKILLLLVGLAILAATFLPRFLSSSPVSMPMIVLGIGVIAGLLTIDIDPGFMYSKTKILESVTEIAVIIALMEAGLKIDRLFGWKTWRIPWRLLSITMLLTILLIWLTGWWIGGLVPATALLLGAVMAPTDPVLASDIQVAAPNKGAKDEESGKREEEPHTEEDEVRFSLTSEAGLNDGLAFPFTYLAVFIAASGFSQEVVWSWLATHVIYKIAVGVGIGYFVGRLAGKHLLSISAYSDHSRAISGLASLALTLILYGVTELPAGYGFIAVFVGALALRRFDPDHSQHTHLHGFIDKTQRIMTAFMILAFGIVLGLGFLSGVTMAEMMIAVLIVFLIRPLSGVLGLLGSGLPKKEIGAISFLGLRGIGSLYYFYYAINIQEFEGQNSVLNIMMVTILLSIVVHGVLSPVIMKRLESAKTK
ncbi:cation:proton antiporter [Aquiflexum sp. TKW24L]|uniref:cation:proton antiporter n=1 Tax=Aquiflexum sp. TKW24L TaxID=2942212 RepID=UPI0020BF356E|nr:cation:proton antiporter [Aquiflexum sp. TKW24L]MCL6261004.1 cation:proton antiporter [Aquiflexum sp. TKW24L]